MVVVSADGRNQMQSNVITIIQHDTQAQTHTVLTLYIQLFRIVP